MRYAHLVIWSAICYPLIRIAYKMAIDEQITRGDLMAVLISAIGLLAAAGMQLWKYYVHHHPFRMFFSDRKYNAEDAIFSSSLHLQVGQHKGIYVGLKLSEGRNIEIIDVRFVEWTWETFKWCNVEPAIIRVVQVHDQEALMPIYNRGDERGGQECTIYPPKHLPKGAFLWLKIDIDAGAYFSGHLSVEHSRGDDYRGFAHAPVTIRTQEH